MRKYSRHILMAISIFLLMGFMMMGGEEHQATASDGQGLLIVTRQMFVDSLTQYLEWKQSRGFDVYVVTAEWIQQNENGSDIRVQIRNCIRKYYRDYGVRYVMLVGDSIDISVEGDQQPPPPDLSESWNLPAGYYWWDVITNEGTPLGAQYTSLYYSDLSDKISYDSSEFLYSGDYQIYVGIVPVRTTDELQTILSKTMNYYIYPQITFVISEDLSSSEHREQLDKILSLTGSTVSADVYYYGTNSSSNDIHETIFAREGVIYELGHGNLDLFCIGNTYIRNRNASDFQYINSLMFTESCYVQAYHCGECLDEAFLKSQKGPVVLTSTPWGPTMPLDDLSDCERGFWTELFTGKTIGQALYDNCNEAWQNPIHLFGDPSLIIFGETHENTYNDLKPHVSSNIMTAQGADYESPDARSLLSQALDEYNLAGSLASQGEWQDAVSHLLSVSNLVTQASAKEEQYQLDAWRQKASESINSATQEISELVNCEDPDAKSLLQQAQTQLTNANDSFDQATLQDYENAYNSALLASSFTNQASVKEQAYQEQKRQQQLITMVGGISIIAIVVIASIAMRRKRRPMVTS